MRRFEESQERDFERSVKLGEDNAQCLRHMSSWCKHVQISPVSSGLYAQITGLPIGSHSIGCPHVQGGWEAMNLRWIFSDFLVQHCATCPHHAPNGDTSWGQATIAEHRTEAEKRERAAKEVADRIAQLRAELRSQSRRIGAEAEPEARRILAFLEEVFSEDEAKHVDACNRLQQSARIGPELFPDPAIDLILILASSDVFSAPILPLCAELAARRQDLATRLTAKALENIKNGLQPELSASVVHAVGEAVTYPLDESCVARLLLSQNHSRPIGGWDNDEPNYSHSTAVLIGSFDANPESVQSVVRRTLLDGLAQERISVCGALKLIQRERPQIAVNLLEPLVRSLALREEHRLSEDTPSGKIIHILQSALRHSPATVDQFLADSMGRVRPAVQEDIIDVYRDQFFDRSTPWEERRQRGARPEVSASEKAAIKRLLAWAKDGQLELDIRANALEALDNAAKYAASEMVSQFDSLLGYFAIVSAQEHPPDAPAKILLPNQPEDRQLKQLDAVRRTQEWRIFKQRLQKCMEEVCEARPSEVFESVSECMNQPLEHLEEGFKACCVSLLGEIGKDYQFRPHVIPIVWHALMDYSSAWVRANAIDAIADMFPYSRSSPPANLADAIIVHLQDTKVIVHKAALKVVSRHPSWFSESQSIEVLNCLGGHLNAYRDDKYQLDDICEGILEIGRRQEWLKLPALRMVKSVFPTGQDLVDSNIAEELTRFCEPREPMAPVVAQCIGTYLARHGRDRYNSYEYSGRSRMFDWLHGMPLAIYQRVADTLLAFAKEVAQRDPWESLHFASLFAHFRAFRYEQIVLQTAATELPDEPRYMQFRAKLQRLAMIASGNSLLYTGDREAAESMFAAGKDGE